MMRLLPQGGTWVVLSTAASEGSNASRVFHTM